MRPYVFLDLDDTLFQTRPKCPDGAELHVAASDPEGRPNSFMTGKQRALFTWLDESAVVIPTTGRNQSAFRRVHLPFRHGAILNFGGTILDQEGAIDARWHGRIHEELAPQAAELAEARDQIEAFCRRQAIEARARVIGDFGLDLYVVVKHAHGDVDALTRVQREHVRPRTDETRFRIHLNGNNLSIVPRGVTKERAIRYLLEGRLATPGGALTIGIGDSLTDAPFLLACDFGLLPRGSQLAEACAAESATAVGTTVTAGS
jgi:hydroxymethylpyrimidine pyrophosphatase-like HAD family hydrolase